MTFFVRPIIRPPANLYKNDGGGGGGASLPGGLTKFQKIVRAHEDINKILY